MSLCNCLECTAPINPYEYEIEDLQEEVEDLREQLKTDTLSDDAYLEIEESIWNKEKLIEDMGGEVW